MTRDKYMDQKKNTAFKYSTRRIGGTNPMLITVAGTHNFPVMTRWANGSEEKNARHAC
jgi:hypothetical protein